jgi:hypothetical protein
MALLRSHLAVLGDYDGNGAVDAGDYTLWRKSLGQTRTVGTGADGSGNGSVDEADFNIWHQSFGKTQSAYYVSAAASSLAVPDPAPSFMLVCGAALGLPCVLKRSRRPLTAVGPRLRHRSASECRQFTYA